MNMPVVGDDQKMTSCCGQETTTESKMPVRDENRVKWEAMGLVSKARFVCKHCTIEPMLGCYIVTGVMVSLCTQNLNLQKACRVNLRMDAGVCSALETRDDGNYQREEAIVQELVADTMIWKTFIQSCIPTVLIVFVGSWSDRNRRRKPCMVVPVIGELITVIGLLVCTYYFYELPVQVSALIESLPPSMTGGWMTMIMAIFSYIGDVSSMKYRTLRIGIANVFYSVALPVGMTLSGILFKKLGFYGVYIIAVVLYLFTIAYGIFVVKETPSVEHDESTTKPETMSFSYFIEDFFNLSNVKEAVGVTFKHGRHNRRLRIISLMVVVIVVMGPLYGEMSMLYMFTRLRFNWNEMDFSIFSTYAMITNLLGTMFSVGVFSHILKIDDALIGLMSCMSKILAGFIYAFASTDFVFYLGPLAEIINGTSFIAMRSIISKLVPSDELGKVNSIFGVCEALVPLIYGPMYSAAYKATLKTFPGAFFLLGSALTTPAAIIFLWMYNEHKKEKKEKDEAIGREEKNCNESLETHIVLDTKSSTHKLELTA